MKLKKILENLDRVKSIDGKAALDVKGLACDSKTVKHGYLFVAIRGSRLNGADFINEAIDRGACAVILEFDNEMAHTFQRGATFIYVDSAREALSKASRAFYGDISKKMRLIGVTGTNGKTTTTYLLESLFNKIKEKTGVIGTINYRFGNRLIPAINTTPSILDLYSLLHEMYKKGINNCIIEVSSHSLEQGRVDTLSFDAAIFTNLSNEHLDFHKNTKNYLASKLKLFTKIKQGGHAIINRDDPCAKKIIEKVVSQKKASVVTYGIGDSKGVCARDIRQSFQGLNFKLCHNECVDITSGLIGRHNVYNIWASAWKI